MLKLSNSSIENGRLVFQVLVQATSVESFDLTLSFDPAEVDLSTAFTVTGPSGWSVLSNKMGSSLLAVGYTTNETPVVAGGTLLQLSLALKMPGVKSAAVTMEGLYNDPAVTVPASAVVLGGTAVPINQLPTGDVVVAIPDGSTPRQGQMLVVSDSLADANGLGPISYTWKAGGTTIGTGATYTLQQAEVGKTITVMASYTDGGNTAESVTSAATAAVANVNDAPTGGVTISGVPTQGQTLTAANTVADVDGLGAITYTWKADGVTAGTGATYTLKQAEVGKAITATASYIDGGGFIEAVSSASTALVGVGDTAGSIGLAAASIADGRLAFQVLAQATAVESFDLTLSFDPSQVDLTTSFTVTGPAGWTVLSNKVGASALLAVGYTNNEVPVPAGGALLQVSLALKVPAAAQTSVTLEGMYNDPAVTVPPSTVVVGSSAGPFNQAPTGDVTIVVPFGASPTQGQTLSVSNTLADTNGLGPLTYIWKAGDATVGVGSTYTLTQAEVGKPITLTASYTDGGNTAEAVTSAATSPVVNIDDEATGSLSVRGTPREGSALTASLIDVADADGPTTTAYQWQQLVGGTWTDLGTFTASTLAIPTDKNFAEKSVRVMATTTDVLSGTTQFVSEALQVLAAAPAVEVEVRAWKLRQAMPDVDVSAGTSKQTTDSAGLSRFTSMVEPSMSLSAAVNPTAAGYADASKAVTLHDAVSILKMIAGQTVNADGAVVSRFQSLAADFDGSGNVGLADAIGVLRHAVGLQAPAPAWVFVKEGDDAMPSILNPGLPGPMTVAVTPPGPLDVQLVGVLRGDVDGSWDPHRFGVSGGT